MGLDNPLHIAFLVVILLLVFGARRLPEIGRSLGSGMREFKQGITGHETAQQPPAQQPALNSGQQSPQTPVAEQAQVVAPPAQPLAAPAQGAQPAPVVAQPATPDTGVEHQHQS